MLRDGYTLERNFGCVRLLMRFLLGLWMFKELGALDSRHREPSQEFSF